MENKILVSGPCGENLIWRLEGKALYIEGTGKMAEFSHKQWKSYCNEIEYVVIADGVSSIAPNAFKGFTNLISITIPDSVAEIGSRAFLKCLHLVSAEIPGSVLKIGGMSFRKCSGLRHIVISEGVTSIGKFAFSHCSGLTSISLPRSISEIGTGAFLDCTNLINIDISKYMEPEAWRVFPGCPGFTNITIPNGVETIDNAAFKNCHGLESVLIPRSVKKIGEYAFWDCTGLTSITIPDSVTEIGMNAFYKVSQVVYHGPARSVNNWGALDRETTVEMDYSTIRDSWGADAKERYSTPLDKLPMKKNLDKFRGCLIGGAAGDALGYTVEFLQEHDIFSQFGENGITEYQLHDGTAWVSDDTQMTMFTANGLLYGTTRVCTRGIMEPTPDTLQ